jgi:hypothetical protein
MADDDKDNDVIDLAAARKRRRAQRVAESLEVILSDMPDEDEAFEETVDRIVEAMETSKIGAWNTLIVAAMSAILDFLEEGGMDRAKAIEEVRSRAKMFGARAP